MCADRVGAEALQKDGAADGKPISVVHTQFNEREAQFSPDTKWIAYDSDETGVSQTYVQPFPPSGDKSQVSNVGGIQPRWRGDGKEIYFFLGGGTGNFWAAGIRTSAGRVEIDPPRQLPVPYIRFSREIHYDVSRDGLRFLLVQPQSATGEDSSAALTVVSNWQATLRQ